MRIFIIKGLAVLWAITMPFLASAKDAPILGLIIGEATPQGVQSQLENFAVPKSKITVGENVVAEKIRIGDQTYRVLAKFKKEDNKQVLSELVLTANARLKKLPSDFPEFRWDTEDKRYENGAIKAKLDETNGRTRITFTYDEYDTFWGRSKLVLIAIAALAVAVIVITKGYFHWLIVGGILSFIFTGNILLGAILSALCAVVHFFIAGSRQNTSIVFVNSNDYEAVDIDGGPGGSPLVNPANGMPMIGGGGVDIAGNAYGTNNNDPL